MKNLLNWLKTGLFALLPLLLQTKAVVGATGAISLVLPELSSLFGGNTLALAGTALYWLELIVRTVPTLSSNTPLTIIIDILQAIVPNQAKSEDGTTGVHVPTSFFHRLFHHQPAAEPAPAPLPDPTPTPPVVAAPVLVASPGGLPADVLTSLQNQLSALTAQLPALANGTAN